MKKLIVALIAGALSLPVVAHQAQTGQSTQEQTKEETKKKTSKKKAGEEKKEEKKTP